MIHKVCFGLNEYMHSIFVYSFNNNLCIYLSQFMYIFFVVAFCIIFVLYLLRAISKVLPAYPYVLRLYETLGI